MASFSYSLGTKLPTITPSAKCKLRLLKLERVKVRTGLGAAVAQSVCMDGC